MPVVREREKNSASKKNGCFFFFFGENNSKNTTLRIQDGEQRSSLRSKNRKPGVQKRADQQGKRGGFQTKKKKPYKYRHGTTSWLGNVEGGRLSSLGGGKGNPSGVKCTRLAKLKKGKNGTRQRGAGATGEGRAEGERGSVPSRRLVGTRTMAAPHENRPNDRGGGGPISTKLTAGKSRVAQRRRNQRIRGRKTDSRARKKKKMVLRRC